MSAKRNVILPVKPARMDVVYYYPCPHCGRELPLISPVQPVLAQCDNCRGKFPVVPVDERMSRFLKVINADGAAAIDQDYL